MGDVINSIGVLIAALVIYFTDGRMWYFDPICTYVFGLIVFYTTRITFSHCISMLMEQTPINVEMSAIKHSLSKVPGVRDVHDLHVWAVSDGKYAMTAHLIVPTTTVACVGNQVIQRCDNILRERFGINHFSI